jgi:hypothetical protein
MNEQPSQPGQSVQPIQPVQPVQPAKPKKNNKRTLIIVAVIVGLLVICCIGGLLINNSSENNSTGQVSVNTPTEIKATQPPTKTPLPTLTLSPQSALRAEIEQVLGKGNRGVPSLTEFSFDDPEKGALFINWAINENLTENLTKRGAKIDATNILKALDKSGIDYTYVLMSGSYPLVDAFGNSTERNVVNLTFNKATVDKINWDNFLTDNIYVIADEAVIWPAFQEE